MDDQEQGRVNSKLFCAGAFLIFLGSVMICSFGFTVVLPHVATRHWSRVQCHVTNSSYNPRKCSCEQQSREDTNIALCFDSYPCLQVRASCQLAEEDMVEIRRRRRHLADKRHMAEDYDRNSTTLSVMLFRSWDDAFHNSCSLHECGDEEWNIKETKRFREEWGRPSSNLTCYLDPEDVTRVILWRTTADQMIHAMVWPSLLLTVGVVIWIGLCCECWDVDNRHLPKDKSRSASSIV